MMPWTAPLRAMSLLQKPASPKDLHAQLELKAKRRADVKQLIQKDMMVVLGPFTAAFTQVVF